MWHFVEHAAVYFHELNKLARVGVGSGVIAVIGGLSSSDILTTAGVIGGVVTVILNLALGWYHQVEKARRSEYLAWRRAREIPIEHNPELENGDK